MQYSVATVAIAIAFIVPSGLAVPVDATTLDVEARLDEAALEIRAGRNAAADLLPLAHDPLAALHLDLSAVATRPPGVAPPAALAAHGAHPAVDETVLTAATRALTALQEAVASDTPGSATWAAAAQTAASDLVAAIAAHDGAPLLGGYVATVCGAFAFDFLGVASTHSCDVPLLIDVGGNDVYTNNAGGASGTMPAAIAIDLGGNDRYIGSRGTGGVNGAAVGGIGILIDARGDDDYDVTVTRGAVNGAGLFGVGVLVDLAGNDDYRARVTDYGAANGAGFDGVGVLIDAAGADEHDAVVTNQGAAVGAGVRGVGLLVDGGGRNFFAATAQAVLGGGLGAVAFPTSVPRSEWATRTVGVLVSGPGRDDFTGTGHGVGGADRYAAGFLIDAGGASQRFTLSRGVGLGGGAHGGLGVLYDAGSSASFTLSAGGAGIALGLQGVGVLHKPFPQSAASFVHGGSMALVARGGGVGSFTVAGTAAFSGSPIEAPCARSSVVGGLGDVTLCAPDYATASEYVRDPSDGDGDPVGGADGCLLGGCSFALDLPGSSHVTPTNVSLTTSGGLHLMNYLESTTRSVQRAVLYPFTGDRMCDFGCGAVT